MEENNDLKLKSLDSMKKKQEFLYENILKVGDNPENFVNFLESKKENGKDINNWSFDELSIIVKEYKKWKLKESIKKDENPKNVKKNLDKSINEIKEKKVKKSITEQKQFYLYQNIIKMGEDPEKFANFLESKKENGKDIKNWNYEELVLIIDEYKKRNKNVIFEDDIKKSTLRNSNIINDLKLKNKNLKIIIINETISGFLVKETFFKIEVLPFKQIIKRSEKDIINLRNRLKLEFPFFHVPPVLCKSYKKEFFQNFFDDLLKNQEFLNSNILENFFFQKEYKILKNVDEKDKLNKLIFKKIKNDWVKEKFSYKIEKGFFNNNNFKSNFNNIDFDNIDKNYNNLSKVVFKNVESLFSLNKNEYYNLKHVGIDIQAQFEGLESNLDKMIFHLNNVIENNEKKNLRKMFIKENEINNLFKNLKKGIQSWKDEIIFKKKYIKDYIVSFYHYYRKDYESFLDLIDFKKHVTNKIEKKLEKLNKEKIKLFKKKEYNNWGISKDQLENINKETLNDQDKALSLILPKKTEDLENDKNLLKSIDMRLINEFILFYNNKIDQILSNFNEFIEKMSEVSKKNIFWEGIDSLNNNT